MSSPDDVNRELARAVEKLTRIVEATKLLHSTLELSELTRIVLRIARDEVGVERGTVFLVSEDGEWLRSLVAQEVDTEIEVRVGSGISGNVAASGQIVDIPNAYEDPRFDSSFDSQFGFKTQDIYCLPVRNRDNKTVGVLELLNRSRPFTQPDKEFLDGISVHIGLALEQAALHQYLIEKKRIERELDLARNILRGFHAKLPTAYGGVQIAGSTTMCHEVGGDYFSFFPVDDENRFIVALGDVSGKGISAALVMTSVHAACRTLLKHVPSIEQVAYSLNQLLNETTEPNVYMTFIMALVDPREHCLYLINAGHTPPLVVDGLGRTHVLKAGGGPPIGMMRGVRYNRESFDIASGSTLVLYTDGVSEATNEKQDAFGSSGISRVVRHHRDESAGAIHSAIRSAVSEFVGAAPTADDATMIVLKF